MKKESHRIARRGSARVPTCRHGVGPLPLLDVLADTRAAFFGLGLDAGQQVLRKIMEQDRERLCGPKNVPNPDRRTYRGGSIFPRGEVTLGGTSRARSVDGHELELPSFAYAAGRDPLKSAG